MRLLRIRHSGDDYYASWLDEATARLLSGPPWDGGTETDRLVPLRKGSLLPPVTPSKIVCVGRNYAAHAEELGQAIPEEPLLFLKPPSSLLAHEDAIVLPRASARVEHEGEVGVVLGARLHHADPRAAGEAIWGITAVNDVTARDLQRQDVQFTRGKGFDTFCPSGPFVTSDEPLSPRRIQVRVNGASRQDGTTSDMIWPVPELLAYISNVMTLEPGDLVLTGTPKGVGPLLEGDQVEVEVEGVGILRNSVQGSG